MSAAHLFTNGYTDLVSVIPPKAELAPTTKIRLDSRGKAPGRQRLDGRWTGYPFLSSDPVTARDIRQWTNWSANVGLNARHFPGLDVDSEDEQLTRFVVQEAQRFLGLAPIRTSREPRRLLVYRTETPFARLQATIKYKGRNHTLEMLGEGRQYLVYGRHPAGVLYGWEGKPLWDWPPDSLTMVDSERTVEFFRHIASKLDKRAVVRISTDRDESTPPPQEALLAPSIDDLRAVVSQIPNDYPDRETYIQVGYAVKAAAGPAHEGEAYDLWADWASRWTHGTNDPETLTADWAGLKPPYRVGWDYLQRMEGAASVVAQQEFMADPDAEAPPYVEGDAPGMSDVWVAETVAQRVVDRLRYLPETDHFHVWGD